MPTTDHDLTDARALFRHVTATGREAVALTFQVLLYYEAPLAECWPAIVHFYREALPLIRDRVRYYVTDGREVWHEVSDETFDMLPFWASADAGTRHVYGLMLSDVPETAGAPNVGFEFYHDGDDPGYVRLLLPPDVARSTGLVEKVLDMVRPFPLLSGSAGFAATVPRDFNAHAKSGPVYGLSRRFKCVDFGKPHLFSIFMAAGVKSAGWITLLGDRWLAALGGLAAGDEWASGGIRIERLQHGVAIVAGERPSLGDVNREEDLDAYRRIDQRIRPVRLTAADVGEYNGIGGTENTHEWLHRFE